MEDGWMDGGRTGGWVGEVVAAGCRMDEHIPWQQQELGTGPAPAWDSRGCDRAPAGAHAQLDPAAPSPSSHHRLFQAAPSSPGAPQRHPQQQTLATDRGGGAGGTPQVRRRGHSARSPGRSH